MPVADYTPIIQQAAQEWNVDPTLLQALIEQESGYNPQTKSKAGALGLTQLMPDTAKGMGVTDPTDPTQQIYGGAKYLSQALDATGDPTKALLYYHGGPDWQKNYGPESAAYVPSVTKRYLALKQADAAPAQNAPTTPADDPFTAAMKDAQGVSAPASSAAADPFTQALEVAQKATTPAAPTVNPDVPGAHPAAPGQNIDPITGFPVDESGAPVQGGKTVSAGVDQGTVIPGNPSGGNIVSASARIGSAIIQGYENTPPILTPAAQQFVDRGGPIGRYITNPLFHIAGAVPAALNAVGAGNSQAIMEGAQALGHPEWGHDLNMLAQVLPFARVGSGLTLAPSGAGGALETPRVNPLTAAHQDILDRQAAALQARTPQLPPSNPLAATVNAPSFVPPGANIPTAPLKTIDDVVNALRSLPDAPARPDFVPPGMARPNPLTAPAPTTVPNALTEAPKPAEPVPQSIGSAASRDLSPPGAIEMTPQQVQAYRSTAEGQKLIEPQQPGIADPNVYVPGVTPNQAEIEQSVNTARELKALNVSAPEVSQEAKEIAADNNDARQKFFSGIAGSDVDIANAKAARTERAEKDLTATWQNKSSADIQPILDAADAIKASPDGKRPLVRSAVDSVTSELTNPDGTPVTDPELLYGVRKHIDDLLSKEAAAADAKNIRAASNLQDLKATLDGVIEQAAPGFGQYLQNFSEASRPIDTMQALQGFENRLYDSQNRMGYNKVQTMMRQIVDSRTAPGLNPFKSIPDETMQQLWNLRDDLRRSASAQELARAPGSDTTQTMSDVLKGVGKSGANLAVHGALVTHLGPYANVLYHGAKNALNAGAEARIAKKQTARGLQILRPDPSQLRNPLQAE